MNNLALDNIKTKIYQKEQEILSLKTEYFNVFKQSPNYETKKYWFFAENHDDLKNIRIMNDDDLKNLIADLDISYVKYQDDKYIDNSISYCAYVDFLFKKGNVIIGSLRNNIHYSDIHTNFQANKDNKHKVSEFILWLFPCNQSYGGYFIPSFNHYKDFDVFLNKFPSIRYRLLNSYKLIMSYYDFVLNDDFIITRAGYQFDDEYDEFEVKNISRIISSLIIHGFFEIARNLIINIKQSENRNNLVAQIRPLREQTKNIQQSIYRNNQIIKKN